MGQGVLPYLIKLLSHPNLEIVERSISALSNIAGDANHRYRDMLLHDYPACVLINDIIMKAIREPFSPIRNELLGTAVWGMNNFVKVKGTICTVQITIFKNCC